MEIHTTDACCYTHCNLHILRRNIMHEQIMSKLSPHFSLEELQHSETAKRLNIANVAPTSAVRNLRRLVTEVLEPLRMHFNAPVIISSGYRSPALNKAVGGVHNSYHLSGRAADIAEVKGYKLREVYEFIRDFLPHTELLLEPVAKSTKQPKWIHVAL